MRDKDLKQVLYPASPAGTQPTSTSVPVCGPDRYAMDAMGVRKSWVVRGPQHEDVLVRLIVANGQFTVSVTPGGSATKTWLNFEAWARTRQTFYITGSSIDDALSPMTHDPSERGVHIAEIECDMDGFATFQISTDLERSLILCPDSAGELRLSPESAELNAWFISGRAGATYEVRLDFGQSDRSRMVRWEPLDGKAIAY